jgi:hypothetical protein
MVEGVLCTALYHWQGYCVFFNFCRGKNILIFKGRNTWVGLTQSMVETAGGWKISLGPLGVPGHVSFPMGFVPIWKERAVVLNLISPVQLQMVQ